MGNWRRNSRKCGVTWRALTVVLITVGVGLDLPSPLLGALGATPRVSAVAAAGGAVAFGGGEIEPLVPARLLDTRNGNGAPVGKVGPDSTTILQVAGRGGVPAIGAGAVVLNVVATEPTANGYVTVYPTGVVRPLASNLNIVTGETVPNLVVVKLGVGGTVSLFNLTGETHLLADVAGWFPETSGLQPMTPFRLLDTREGNGAALGPAAAGSTTHLQVTGRGGVPSVGVGAVVLNVTVAEPTANGFVTVFPAGETQPVASNLNFTPGLTVPNLVIAKVGAGGAVSMFNSAGDTHLIADVAGWFPTASGFHPINPTRLLDTRDGTGAPLGTVGQGSTVALQVAGRNGLPPTGIGAVVVNVTATNPTASGFVTVYPAGVDPPTASNLNVRPGQTVPNLVIAKLGAGGVINLFNSAGDIHLIADVVGWFPDGGTNATTLTLNNGTVLAGAGDVVAFTGNADTGGTITLSASADVPVVGGHIAVAAHAVVPDGLFGKVAAVVVNADATTTLTYVPAVLEDGFADIESSFHGFVEPDPILQTEMLLRMEATAGCKTSGGLSISPILTIGGGGLVFDYDLTDRFIHFDLELKATVGVKASFTGALSCTIEIPEYPIPIPFATVSATPRFTLSVSAGLTTTATLSTSVHFGFEARGSAVENLSSFTPAASGDVDAAVSASMTFRPAIRVKVQLFGIAGGYVDLGINFTGTVEPLGLPCATLTYQLTLDFGFSAGKWGVEWNIALASIQGPKVTVFEKNVGCPNISIGAWRGVVTFEEVWSGNGYEETFRSTFTDTSLLSTEVSWTGSRIGRGRFPCAVSGFNGYDIIGSVLALRRTT